MGGVKHAIVWAVLLRLAAPALALAGEGTGGLELWLTAPDATVTRPLDFALVRRDAEGRVVSPGEVEVEARPGRVAPLDCPDPRLRCFQLIPPPAHRGELLLVASAGEARVSRRLVLGPPESARIELSVEPAVLVKRPGATATVRVKVTGSSGGVIPILSTNLGEVGPLEPEGEGAFRATYRPSEKRYPEVAILSAFLPFPDASSPAFALAQVQLPLPAAIDLPGKTRPRVQMSVEIAGETFGPVPSDERGHFQVPVVVPPGHGEARGVSIDKLGNRRRTPIDLRLPPTNRLAATAHPRTLVADGHSMAQVVVTVIDAFGRPAEGSAPVLAVERGRLSAPEPAGVGSYRAWYTAPVGVGEGLDRLTVTLPRDRKSKATLELRLLPGPPVTASVEVEPGVVAAPSDEQVRIQLSVQDAWGSPVAAPRVSVEAARGRVRADAPLALRYLPPSTPEGWEDPLTIRISPAREPRAVAAAIDVEAGALVLLGVGGRPVPGTELTIGEAESTRTDAQGEVPLPEGETISLRWAGRGEDFLLHRALDLEGRPVVFPGHRRELVLTSRVILMEPEPVRVRVAIEAVGGAPALVRWSVNPDAGERRVRLQVGEREPIEQRGLSGEWRGEAAAGELVTVTDLETGVIGVVEMRAP
ncbi:MAG: Ig-like domain-containing protein [Deltaproteobacteria bacterium]|nr:Ig-like domain-containing protein [Deltaproteobacteria bacterium]